jgi:hypothetical protein
LWTLFAIESKLHDHTAQQPPIVTVEIPVSEGWTPVHRATSVLPPSPDLPFCLSRYHLVNSHKLLLLCRESSRHCRCPRHEVSICVVSTASLSIFIPLNEWQASHQSAAARFQLIRQRDRSNHPEALARESVPFSVIMSPAVVHSWSESTRIRIRQRRNLPAQQAPLCHVSASDYPNRQWHSD